MSVRVDPSFIRELEKFGAFDINACFNCGNCTAICPLSQDIDRFPRRMIRLAQIGAKDRLISDRDMWLCYYCGECSQTCPRQAEPGEFMASMRRYAISSFDPTGISKLLYTSKWFSLLFILGLSIVFALILLSGEGPMIMNHPALFKLNNMQGFLPFGIIHHLGIAVIVIAFVAAMAGVLRMLLCLYRNASSIRTSETTGKKRAGFFGRIIPAAKNVIAELLAQKRYRDCTEQNEAPWYRSRWFLHWSIMWGFMGLGAATGFDYVWMMIGNKIPGQPDPFWYAGRLIGTIAGVFLMYGTAMVLISRFRKLDKYFEHSLLSDWLFIWLLFFTGLTGFLVELEIYLPTETVWGYVVFLVHVVFGMEIVVLLPFTKFAHAVYRPFALFIYEFTSSSS